jgi:alanine dehydrogenase
MIVGVPTEIKPQENRVGLIPSGVKELVSHGHKVLVQQSAGLGSGVSDDEYIRAGATIVPTAEEVWGKADMVWKVKEPLASEYGLMRKGQILYTYLHLAPDLAQTQALMKSGNVAIAYETIQTPDGALPLLAPMSEVAGRLSIQAGARCLEKVSGGRGVLLGGVPGVLPGRVLVIGGGIVGANAVRMAQGMGAEVVVMDIDINVLRTFDDQYRGAVRTLFSTPHSLEQALSKADLVVGAVLVAGARAPHIISRAHLGLMKPGAAIVDVAVDQGGCAETTKPTTHADPTYVVDGIVHYAVANMPGAVARTSTFALNNATLRYGLRLADQGWERAVRDDAALKRGLNVCQGHVTYKAVADAHGLPYQPLD